MQPLNYDTHHILKAAMFENVLSSFKTGKDLLDFIPLKSSPSIKTK